MTKSQPDTGLAQAQLESRAHQLAESHIVTDQPGRKPYLLNRVQEQEALLREAYSRFAGAPKVELALSYSAEWILDNFYVVERALRQVREDMPEGSLPAPLETAE